MSGIERYDQMLSYQSGLRKTARWYKKVGIHIFEFFFVEYILPSYEEHNKAIVRVLYD